MLREDQITEIQQQEMNKAIEESKTKGLELYKIRHTDDDGNTYVGIFKTPSTPDGKKYKDLTEEWYVNKQLPKKSRKIIDLDTAAKDFCMKNIIYPSSNVFDELTKRFIGFVRPTATELLGFLKFGVETDSQKL